MDPLAALRKHPAAKWIGIALIVVSLVALPFVLQIAGTAWIRITNLAVLFVLRGGRIIEAQEYMDTLNLVQLLAPS